MEKLTEVLAMGGYGAYIWPAYGFASLVLVVLLISTLRASRRASNMLSQLQKTPADEA